MSWATCARWDSSTTRSTNISCSTTRAICRRSCSGCWRTQSRHKRERIKTQKQIKASFRRKLGGCTVLLHARLLSYRHHPFSPSSAPLSITSAFLLSFSRRFRALLLSLMAAMHEPAGLSKNQQSSIEHRAAPADSTSHPRPFHRQQA